MLVLTKLENIKEQMDKGGLNVEIHCHPDNVEILRQYVGMSETNTFDNGFTVSARSIPVHTNEVFSKETKTWVFPKPVNRFYEYTKSDEEWARGINFGYERSDLAFYIFEKPRYYGHKPSESERVIRKPPGLIKYQQRF
jgi:hypothetical protein